MIYNPLILQIKGGKAQSLSNLVTDYLTSKLKQSWDEKQHLLYPTFAKFCLQQRTKIESRDQ